jgi:hypothetical protein
MGRAHEERVDEYLRRDKIRNGIGRYNISELTDKLECHIRQYMVHNRKHQHNSAIHHYIVMFDLVEERGVLISACNVKDVHET